MPLFGRRRKGADTGIAAWKRGGIDDDDRAYLDAFASSRRGVEAYLEPATTVTPYTIVLVAHDGEWTRRPCHEPEAAVEFAKKAGIPFYDLKATGYPPRMREWTAARKRAGGDGQPASQRRRPDDHEMPPDPFA